MPRPAKRSAFCSAYGDAAIGIPSSLKGILAHLKASPLSANLKACIKEGQLRGLTPASMFLNPRNHPARTPSNPYPRNLPLLANYNQMTAHNNPSFGGLTPAIQSDLLYHDWSLPSSDVLLDHNQEACRHSSASASSMSSTHTLASEGRQRKVPLRPCHKRRQSLEKRQSHTVEEKVRRQALNTQFEVIEDLLPRANLGVRGKNRLSILEDLCHVVRTLKREEMLLRYRLSQKSGTK